MKVKLPFPPFYIYYFGLLVMAVGMPVSIFLMSISYVIMAIGWLLTRNYWERIRTFAKNKIAMVLSSLFILHLIGLIYTDDLASGMNDVKIKLPLLLLPFMISTMPKLNAVLLRWLLYIFCAAVFVGTIIGCFILMGYGKTKVVDVRQLSPFISHIRFSLMISLAIFILAYFAKKDLSWKLNFVYFPVIAWFFIYLFILESLTGIIILFLASGFMITYSIFTRRTIYLKLLYLLCLGGAGYFLYYSIEKRASNFYVIHDTADLHHLDSLSPHGHAYVHDPKNDDLQNGFYTSIYQCWEEMAPAWNRRSKINFDTLDKKGNEMKYTLIRYLTSKGSRKDEDGVNALTDKDVACIEMGIPDVRYSSMSKLEARIDATIWEFHEYTKDKDPSGHSVAQRFEFWKAAIGIIKKHPVIGVGTGDATLAFKEEYNSNGTKLDEKHRLRSHDQFLAIGVTFGIIGLLWFLFSLFYPLTLKLNRKNMLYMCFFLIAIFSMINEDTLETQAGVTFFAFFNTVLLLGRAPEKKD